MLFFFFVCRMLFFLRFFFFFGLRCGRHFVLAWFLAGVASVFFLLNAWFFAFLFFFFSCFFVRLPLACIDLVLWLFWFFFVCNGGSRRGNFFFFFVCVRVYLCVLPLAVTEATSGTSPTCTVAV